MSDTKPRIVILGGGFGGMYAALEFERAMARGADLDVTLVNRDKFFLFTPMLHEELEKTVVPELVMTGNGKARQPNACETDLRRLLVRYGRFIGRPTW